MATPESTSPASTAAPPLGLATRALGVIFSPRATYADVAARPRVFGALVLIIAIAAVVNGVFAATEVGRDAILDVAIRWTESLGFQVSDDMYSQIAAGIDNSAVRDAVIIQVVFLLSATVAVAGLLLGVFSAIMGGRASFRHVYAVVVHSGFIITLSQLFATPLNYAKGSISSPANLAVFLPFLDEASFVARLLGSIDLFIVWWLVNLAIGLGVLYTKRTAPVANSLLAAYGCVVVVVAVVRTSIAGA